MKKQQGGERHRVRKSSSSGAVASLIQTDYKEASGGQHKEKQDLDT